MFRVPKKTKKEIIKTNALFGLLNVTKTAGILKRLAKFMILAKFCGKESRFKSHFNLICLDPV